MNVERQKRPFFDNDFKIVKEWWSLIFKATTKDKRSDLSDVLLASLLQGITESSETKE